MPNDEVIRCATCKEAEELGISKDRGTLAPGKFADLLILKKDPLKDLHAYIDDLEAVYKEGSLVI